MFPGEWLYEAEKQIKPHIRKTPLTDNRDEGVIVKWENHQTGGSFKLRGALNKVLSLQGWELERGLVAASAGNHGIGVAWAGNLVQSPVIIFTPQSAAVNKLQTIRDLGAQIELVPGGYSAAEEAGREHARRIGAVWISPYNDGQVIAGQGTLGLEILDQSETSRNSTWVVPVGGGGLISGIGAAIEAALDKKSLVKPKLVGVQSDASPYFHELFHNKSQEDILEQPSIAEGLSGPIENGSITVPLVNHYVDDLILVSEKSIAEAVAHIYSAYGEIVEGSAATTFAALMQGKIYSRPVVLVITGGNIDRGKHQEIIQNYS